MKTSILLLFVLLIISGSSLAEIALRFNHAGEFVSPDKIIQERAIKAYKRGQTDTSIKILKRSVKFGSDSSKYMIALMYFEKKDLASSYSWLKFVNEPIQNRDDLIKKIGNVLTKDEKVKSDILLASLHKEYSDDAIFKRRTRWSKNKTVTGTNIAGLHMLKNSGVLLSPGTFAGGLLGGSTASGSMNIPNGIRISNVDFSKTLDGYLIEYHPKTRVYLGEIQEKDSND